MLNQENMSNVCLLLPIVFDKSTVNLDSHAAVNNWMINILVFYELFHGVA